MPFPKPKNTIFPAPNSEKCPLLAQSGHLSFALPRTSGLSFDICCNSNMATIVDLHQLIITGEGVVNGNMR